ncbi:MAG: response regulator, partial [Ignavibacteriales bacterium]|nr:response regulator [Ignavibacteriales bacterium]
SIGRPDKEQAEALDFIDQNRENLLDIMNSISEFAQIKSASTDLIPDEVSIASVIEDSIQEEREEGASLGKELNAGRISSSLLVYTDKNRLKGFISQAIKVLSRITEENTVYISSQQYDDEFFIITFRDNYSRISEKLLANFEGFFNGKSQISPKNFHLSRYNFSSMKELMKLLKSEYEVVLRSGKPYEIGFKFPMNLFEEKASVREEVEIDNFRGTPKPLAPTPAYADSKSGVTKEVIPDPFKQSFINETGYQQHSAPFTETIRPAAKAPEHGFAAFESPAGSFSDDDFVVPVSEKFSFQSNAPSQATIAKKESTSYRALDFNNPVEAPFTQQPVHVEQQQFTPPVFQEPSFTVPAMSQTPVQNVFSLSDFSCLYIEDQVDSQILFKVQMKELREIRFAVSFEEALPLLTSYNFDFIVMDINLQGEYNGLDALKMIHQMPQFSHLPIIAVTAYVLPGDKDKFILAGFNDFISKPIFREKMIDSLEKIFKKKVNS